ncbi:MAG: carboxypeptidase regulatory-like domain-containing protein [Chitinispirillaceae bacterium]|nr:carboxypeptidase regulatory-like domain-containing protein [Chitinispirillaceae bacterium]
MYQRVVLPVLIFIGLTLNQTVNADIRGKVSDQAGKPIKGATVTLVSNGATATTGADGRYTLATTDVKTLLAPQPQNTGITLQKGFLNFSLPEAAPVQYEIFDVKGNLLDKKVMKNARKGIYRFNIAENARTTTLLIIRTSIGSEEKTFNYLSLNSNHAAHSQNRFSTPVSGGLAKITAVADTIKVTAAGYKAQAIAVTSYDMELNVTMEATGTGGDCGEFTIVSNKTSTAIPTVGIIEWSYSKEVTSAVIEFGRTSKGDEFEAPVDLKEKNYRTLLLGMKQNTEYTYRIVVNGSCKSDNYTITTGRLSITPNITKSGSGSSSIKSGFIVTTTDCGWAMGGGMGGGGTPKTAIFDMDGDVVWAAEAPKGVSRARMSWDGKNMWAMNANNMGTATSGEMRRISMDGLDVERNVSGLSGADHDFTVTPDNAIVAIVFKNGGGSAVIKRTADGTISTIVADLSTLYQPQGGLLHPNYIRFYEFDGGFFTLSDRNTNNIVKFRPDGKLVWQFGGSNPKGKSFSLSQGWEANHGHELEEDGRVILFNNGAMMGGATAKVLGYKLNESTMSASKSWEKTANGSSMSLGDVQHLPGDHILVTVSNAGKMELLDSSRNVVLTFSTAEFGYTKYRESLYGPPIDY